MIAPPADGKPLIGTITHTLGDLALLIDDTPPFIHRLALKELRSRKPTITFHFGDDRSGVEYEELKMYIDGVAAIPEIDGEHHRAALHCTTPLTQGSHQLTIRLKDKSGNTSTLERRFDIR
jgi:hypothetical protein